MTVHCQKHVHGLMDLFGYEHNSIYSILTETFGMDVGSSTVYHHMDQYLQNPNIRAYRRVRRDELGRIVWITMISGDSAFITSFWYRAWLLVRIVWGKLIMRRK